MNTKVRGNGGERMTMHRGERRQYIQGEQAGFRV